MVDFARVHSISHVRIRYALTPAVALDGPWTDGHDPTKYMLKKPAGQRVRLSIVSQTAPIVSTVAIPSDPGPYVLGRDGITERVLQQPTVVVPPPTITEPPQGDVVNTGPERTTPTRLRGAGGRFISMKTGEGTRISTKPTSASATTVSTKGGESSKVTTGKRRTPVGTKTSTAIEPTKVNTGTPKTPSTPTTKKPKGPRVRTKK